MIQKVRKVDIPVAGLSTRMFWFNVFDDCNRESLAIDIDISVTAQRVMRSLQQIIE